jgi:hypothetical protein
MFQIFDFERVLINHLRKRACSLRTWVTIPARHSHQRAYGANPPWRRRRRTAPPNLHQRSSDPGRRLYASRHCLPQWGVEQAVTNQVVDIGLLMQTAEPARVILDVERIDVVADRGYFKIEDIEACEKAGLTPQVPKPQRTGGAQGLLHQGGVPLRSGPGRLYLPGWKNSGAAPPR